MGPHSGLGITLHPQMKERYNVTHDNNLTNSPYSMGLLFIALVAVVLIVAVDQTIAAALDSFVVTIFSIHFKWELGNELG